MRRALRALGVVLVASLALAGSAATPAHAGASHAVVVVDTGSSVITRTITFGGTISGYQALELAGASPVSAAYGGLGSAVCALFGVGNGPASCLDAPSWFYYRAPAGTTSWTMSGAGASSTWVGDGDVEGWRLGGGSPRVSVCAVKECAPPPPPPPAPPPPAPGGGTTDAAVSGGGGAGSASAPGAGSGIGEAASAETGEASADPTVATTTPTGPTATAGGSTNPTDRSRDDRRALGPPVVSDDPGAGSPVGVMVALGLVAGLAGVAFVVRRRGRPTG